MTNFETEDKVGHNTSHEDRGLIGTWWVSCLTDTDYLSGGEYTFGFAGVGAEPDWSEVADISMECSETGESVFWMAERYVPIRGSETGREIRYRMYRPMAGDDVKPAGGYPKVVARLDGKSL